MSADKEKPFAHLSNDLDADLGLDGPAPPPLPRAVTPMSVSEARSVVPPPLPTEEVEISLDDDLPMVVVGTKEMPTQIVRAHKALERAREKRRVRVEEGRTLVIDRDRPPSPASAAPILRYAVAALAGVGLAALAALVVWQATLDDVVDEAIAEELAPVEEEALPIEAPPQPMRVEEVQIAQVPPVVIEAPPVEKRARKSRRRAVEVRPTEEPAPAPAGEQAIAAVAEGVVLEPPPEVEEQPADEPAAAERAVEEEETPKVGFISIKSSAEGAEVQIDSRVVGRVPLERHELAPGRHAVWITLRGYQVWQKDVLVRAGEPLELDVKLEPIPPP